MPPDQITWFVDENSLLLARRLAERQPRILYPGHPQLPQVPSRSPDALWLPVVGELGLVVITRDTRIRYRPVERMEWVAAAVRGFVLTAAGNLRIAEQLELIESNLVSMEEIVRRHPDGPWMYAITRRGLRQLIPDA